MSDSRPPLASGRRLHPFTLLQRFLISLPALAFLVLPAVREPSTERWLNLAFLAVYGVFLVPLFVLQYLRFRYAITEREIVIERGVLTRQYRNIPIERIQNIAIEQSLVPRLFGTARVKIETAGSTTTEGVLEFVGLEEAHRIREAVRTYQHRQGLGAPGEVAAPLPDAAVPPGAEVAAPPAAGAAAPLFRMTGGRVLLAGAFRFSLVYIAVIFSLVEYGGFSEEELLDVVTGGRLERITEQAAADPLLAAFVTLVVVIGLAWLTGIATTVSRYHRFTLTGDGEKLHLSHGLLTRTDETIPLKKIQALVIRTNPLMRAFGWYRLELQTMGVDVRRQMPTAAVPFGRMDEILAVARTVRPLALPDTFQPVSRRTIRRALVRYVTLLVLAAAAAYALWPLAPWALVPLLPAAAWLSLARYRRHGYAIGPDVFFVRRGVLLQDLWIVPFRQLQAFHVEGTAFQRRLGLRSVVVDTAGWSGFRYPSVVDLPEEEAHALVARLNASFKALFPRHARAAAP